jgi:hypothetical protein
MKAQTAAAEAGLGSDPDGTIEVVPSRGHFLPPPKLVYEVPPEAYSRRIPENRTRLKFGEGEGHEFTRATVGLSDAALAAEVCREAYAHDVPAGNVFRDIHYLAATKAFRCRTLRQTIPENFV